MGLFSEFKAFINRGSVIDLAVGVIIGGAFATITQSLTDDLIMPVVGYIFGGGDLSGHFIRLSAIPAEFTGNRQSYAELKAAGVAMVGWGQFLSVMVNFVILAFIIFLVVRAVNRMSEKPETAPPAPTPEDVTLLREIRDLLKK